MGFQLEKKMVYVIGDLSFTHLVSKVIQNLGVETEIFFDANFALEAFKKMSIPNIVIIDCQNLNKNSYQFLNFMTQNDRISSIPLIIYVSDEKIKNILQKKYSDSLLLDHPFIAGVLVHNIKRMMKKREDDFSSDLVNLRQNEKVELKAILYGKMTKICETSCMISSPLKLEKNWSVDLGVKSSLFKKEQIGVSKVRGRDGARFVGEGIYESKYTLIGLNETEAQKIRMIINGNFSNKK